MSERIIDALEGVQDTVVVDVGRGAITRAADALLRGFGDEGTLQRPVTLITDENTWHAAGKHVTEILKSEGLPTAEPLVLPGTPRVQASLAQAREIEAWLSRQPTIPVAVGSGTLGDLTKLAAHSIGTGYAIIGTAASMDGYTGSGAPITDNGVKRTIECTAPRVVILDLDVIASAPGHLVASGCGDLSAKFPGGADWIIADACGVETIDPHVWKLVQGPVRSALADPKGLAAGTPESYADLVAGLVLSGLAMQVYGGTRPASGAEHYFSHIWELEGLGHDRDVPPSHGDKVAIGTLAMLAFHECFLKRGISTDDVAQALDQWPNWDAVETDIRSRFAGALADHAVKETRVKYLEAGSLEARLTRAAEAWPITRDRLTRQLMTADELTSILRVVGAPTRPEDIGLDRAQVRDTFSCAMYYRSRYTVLDLAREFGIFDEIVAEVFAPGGLWDY